MLTTKTNELGETCVACKECGNIYKHNIKMAAINMLAQHIVKVHTNNHNSLDWANQIIQESKDNKKDKRDAKNDSMGLGW